MVAPGTPGGGRATITVMGNTRDGTVDNTALSITGMSITMGEAITTPTLILVPKRTPIFSTQATRDIQF